LVSVLTQLTQELLSYSTSDRNAPLLELLQLLDRDLTYVSDIVKKALQVKKTGTGDPELLTNAEKLLQIHKPCVTLVGPLITLLPNEDVSLANMASHNL
ncbi:unnamed protein product, partial [Didymodactylos carnosus]